MEDTHEVREEIHANQMCKPEETTHITAYLDIESSLCQPSEHRT